MFGCPARLPFTIMGMRDPVTLITALSSLLGTLATLIVAIRTNRTGKQTHEIVNSQRTAMQKLSQDKDDALQAGGIPIPHDTSLNEP